MIAARKATGSDRSARREASAGCQDVLREPTHVQPVPHRGFYIRPRFSLVYSFQAGGLAGTSVDLLFYPIDSVKTRLQSDHGFYKAGGFRGIYNGLGSVVVGSAPGGILFPPFVCLCQLCQLPAPRPQLPFSFVPMTHSSGSCQPLPTSHRLTT